MQAGHGRRGQAFQAWAGPSGRGGLKSMGPPEAGNRQPEKAHCTHHTSLSIKVFLPLFVR